MASIVNIVPFFVPIAERIVRGVLTIFAKVAEPATIALSPKMVSVIGAIYAVNVR